jgi:hypothetical protein
MEVSSTTTEAVNTVRYHGHEVLHKVGGWLQNAKEHALNVINHITTANFHWTAGWSIAAGGVGVGLALLVGAILFRRHRAEGHAAPHQPAAT